MKRMILAVALVFGSAGASLADPAEGLWQTQPGESGGYLHVQVSECGPAICGVIKRAFDKNGKDSGTYEHLGKRMLWDMKAKGGGAYRGGKIWTADTDKTYKSKLALNGDTMKVQGCVFGICRGQDWKRVK